MKLLRNLSFLLLSCWMLAGLTLALDVEIQNPKTAQYEAVTVEEVGLLYDGQPLETDVPAMLYQERTMVPVRVISETLGAQVDWVQETQTVIIEQKGTTIYLTIGNADALVNGETVLLYDKVAPILVRMGDISRTMVPLRFVSEQLGLQVAWDNESRSAILTTTPEETAEVAMPTVENGVVSIPYTGTVETKTMALEDRLVVDLGGGLLAESSYGTISVGENGLIAVRYNQYDTGMEGFDRVTRVVLDLEVHPEDCLVEEKENMVEITLPEMVVEPEGQVEPEEEPKPEEAPDGPVVVLDAGHGGTEVSAVHFGVDEKELTLPVTLQVGAILEEAGYDVRYTRTEDVKVTLAQRADLANQINADIFVSIHFNAFPPQPTVEGIETFYVYGGEASKVLADTVHGALIENTGAVDRKVKQAGYYVLKNTTMPAILVEGGFMTNQAELEKLCTLEYQAKISQGIANGIMAYFGK